MQSITASDQNAVTHATGASEVQADPGISTRLPEPLTSFIGREREIEDVLTMLKDPHIRLVTLTGPGGIGKTRMAIKLAHAIALDANMTVAFIPLAPLSDPSLLASTIGSSFGLNDNGNQSLAVRLSTLLHCEPFLLVLDNFEHLVDAAPLVAMLLGSCPSLKILATSRRSLHLSGEVEYLVPSLATANQEDAAEFIATTPSFRLFVERSPALKPGSDRSQHDHEIAVIGEICSRLDGLPLAIELAAARTRVLSPSEILARIDQRMFLLTGGPQDAPIRLRSMRDATSWSYDLLSADEQRLLRSLAVFSGGFTLDAIEAVAPDDLNTPTLNLLTRLIDHNLVRRMDTPDGTTRFTMLETIREFAVEHLKANGEEVRAHDAHLHWLLAQLGYPTPERWNEMRAANKFVLHNEHDNLRAAMAWALQQGEAERAAQAAWGLLPFWWKHGLNAEGLSSLQRLIDQPEALDPILRAGILCRIVQFTQRRGDYQRSYDAAAEALGLCRECDYDLGVHASLFCLGLSDFWIDPPAAVDWFGQAIEISRGLEDKRWLPDDLGTCAGAFIALGAPERALSVASEALSLFRTYEGQDEMQHGYALALVFASWATGMLERLEEAEDYAARGLAIGLEFGLHNPSLFANRNLGQIALTRGDYRLAFEHLRETLLALRREGAEGIESLGLVQSAMLCQVVGDWNRAARLFGYVESAWTRFRFAESTMAFATWQFDTVPTRLALGDDAFSAAFEAGRRLTSNQAFEMAMGLTVPQSAAKHRDTDLTPRELDVLHLLAQGKTNQEIAADLFLGKSTIDTHVSHILAKLGVDSRRAAVRVARDRGLHPE